MRLLLLGGTWFVGRALLDIALARDHRVTLFNRGQTRVPLPDGVAVVRGDRTRPEDLARLARAGPWDAVVDVHGVVPRKVGDAVRALGPSAGRYAFVSTVSAYRDWPEQPVAEDSPLHNNDPDADPPSWRWGTGTYGPLKAGAEAALRRELDGGRLLVVRPGPILGPGEYGGRLTWWLGRAALGGRLLAPRGRELSLCPLDVRDLAGFILDRLADGGTGTFNVAGPRSAWTDFVSCCVETTGGRAEPVWVDDGWLERQGVLQWTELPLWRLAPGTWRVDVTRATAAGLLTRPLSDTVRDTWAWLAAGGEPVTDERRSRHGIHAKREAALLAAWDEEVTGQPEVPADPTG